jgi:hypothetical protein
LSRPDFHVTSESSELRLFTEREIPWDDIAFQVIRKTLQQYLIDRSSGTFPFQVLQIPELEIGPM